jgi:hypothetical protein
MAAPHPFCVLGALTEVGLIGAGPGELLHAALVGDQVLDRLVDGWGVLRLQPTPPGLGSTAVRELGEAMDGLGRPDRASLLLRAVAAVWLAAGVWRPLSGLVDCLSAMGRR